MLQFGNRIRCEHMLFALMTESVFTADVQKTHRLLMAAKRFLMQAQ